MTETDLRAEEILHLYARCWGVNNLWQQKRTCAGVMDADSLDSVDTGSVIKSGCDQCFPYRCRGTLARQTTTDRRSGGAVATHGIYRTCFQGQFEPEVHDIHLSKTARRSKIAGVAAPSAANSMNFVRFTPSCAIVRVTQGWGLDV